MNAMSNMKYYRLMAGLSQREIAEKIGIGRQYYCNIENGRQNTTLVTLEKIAGAIGCKAADLLGEHKEK